MAEELIIMYWTVFIIWTVTRGYAATPTAVSLDPSKPTVFGFSYLMITAKSTTWQISWVAGSMTEDKKNGYGINGHLFTYMPFVCPIV